MSVDKSKDRRTCFNASIVVTNTETKEHRWDFGHGPVPPMLIPASIPVFNQKDEFTVRIENRDDVQLYIINITPIITGNNPPVGQVPFLAPHDSLSFYYNPADTDPNKSRLKLGNSNAYLQWSFTITAVGDDSGIDPEFQVGPGSAPTWP